MQSPFSIDRFLIVVFAGKEISISLSLSRSRSAPAGGQGKEGEIHLQQFFVSLSLSLSLVHLARRGKLSRRSSRCLLYLGAEIAPQFSFCRSILAFPFQFAART
ncbi:hypothetical protein BT93_L3658 [Corymbia citriodora subsp. variegata]|uniref:Uncharacterized protein n=1 Tax=Corymbia citriodora subsp. variegata TaxID=360336 RepID=A0A8T0CLE4_CORYI|nr:hypothetical protein BT93_L3658 [Corymbia citriodora subsp. variegata]